MALMIIASDIGGAKAILPLLQPLAQKTNLHIIDNGVLPSLYHTPFSANESINTKEKFTNYVMQNNITMLLFGTAVKDTLPLQLASWAKELSIKTICILDNWMNYKQRLVLNNDLVLPDIYAVMDKLAYDGAIGEGIPEKNLVITGHPALASLDLTKAHKNTSGRKLIIFVAEPVLQDQGNSRGYTEYTALEQFYNALLPYKEKIEIGLLPHPRQNKEELFSFWEKLCTDIPLNRVEKEGREAIYQADLLAGMVSILLYEAWLLNKPTLSFQPGLIRDDLRHYENRKGCYCVTNIADIAPVIQSWLHSEPKIEINPDLQQHQKSIELICDLITKPLT